MSEAPGDDTNIDAGFEGESSPGVSEALGRHIGQVMIPAPLFIPACDLWDGERADETAASFQLAEPVFRIGGENECAPAQFCFRRHDHFSPV